MSDKCSLKTDKKNPTKGHVVREGVLDRLRACEKEKDQYIELLQESEKTNLMMRNKLSDLEKELEHIAEGHQQLKKEHEQMVESNDRLMKLLSEKLQQKVESNNRLMKLLSESKEKLRSLEGGGKSDEFRFIF